MTTPATPPPSPSTPATPTTTPPATMIETPPGDVITTLPGEPQADHKDKDLVSQMVAWLNILIPPRSVVALRIPKYKSRPKEKPHTRGGFFHADHLGRLVWEALYASQYAPGVYFTINELRPDILARRPNNIGKASKQADASDVVRRRWLLIDIDPVRRGKKNQTASATDAEKAKAFAKAIEVGDWLRAKGFPDPVVVDSGNGYYLLYRVDLPAGDADTVERVLKAISARFSDDEAKIDESVFDLPRIAKVPGTWAKKGQNTPESPHRRVCTFN